MPRAGATREKGQQFTFFLSFLSATDTFHKESVKTIVQRRRILPSSSWVRASRRVRGWRVEDPGESSRIKYRLAPPDPSALTPDDGESPP